MCIRILFWGIGLRNLGCKYNELTSTYKQRITVSIYLQTCLNYSAPTEISNIIPTELSSRFLLNLASGSYTVFC